MNIDREKGGGQKKPIDRGNVEHRQHHEKGKKKLGGS